MLDIRLIRENPEIVREALQNDTWRLKSLMKSSRLTNAAVPSSWTLRAKKAERNIASKEIGKMKDKEAREAKIAATRELGDEIARLDEKLKGVEEALYAAVAGIPNIPPDTSVPYGADDKENVVLQQFGEKKVFDFEPKPPHWDLGPPDLGIID